MQRFWTRWWSQIFFNVHSYLGKISRLTNIFQWGWNHQLERFWSINSTFLLQPDRHTSRSLLGNRWRALWKLDFRHPKASLTHHHHCGWCCGPMKSWVSGTNYSGFWGERRFNSHEINGVVSIRCTSILEEWVELNLHFPLLVGRGYPQSISTTWFKPWPVDPQTLVTNNPWNGHLIIPKRSQILAR